MAHNRAGTKRSFLVMAMVAAVVSAPKEELGAEAPANPDIRHPLIESSATYAEDKPFVDTTKGPNGGEYVVQEGCISLDEWQEPICYSGVFEEDSRFLTDEERSEISKDQLFSQDITNIEYSAHKSKLAPEVIEAISASCSEDILQVIIACDDSGIDSITNMMDAAMADGKANTADQYESSLLEARSRREIQFAGRVTELSIGIESIGGVIKLRCEMMCCVIAEIRADSIQDLEINPAITRIEMNKKTATMLINGNDILYGTQLHQYNQYETFDGEGATESSTDDILFAVIEPDGVDNHVGFTEPTSSRILARYECGAATCSWVSSFSETSWHFNAVAGLIFGDLLDDQDAAISSYGEQVKRSGYANEARGYLYGTNGDQYSYRSALQHVQFRSPKPVIVNLSEVLSDDENCTGETITSQFANDIYESGSLPIVAAGNSPGSAYDCTVNDPGSAIGVFTVGGHGTSDSGDANTVKSASIWPNSAFGGSTSTYSEGKYRTIIDATSYAYRNYLFDSISSYDNSGWGTSLSAPTVSAAAIDIVDWYSTTYGNMIKDPGVLFSTLLLMGDGQGRTYVLSQGFDPLWGSGRLRTRIFTPSGMDSPYGWSINWLCIANGQVISLHPNNGNKLSSDVDSFRAVAFWYDSRHQTGQQIDNIDMKLWQEGTTRVELGNSHSLYDNKERIYLHSIGGRTLTLEIIGTRVTSTEFSANCGSGNRMKVYFAYFFEDSDRDDIDGPDETISPE